jgi:starch synthase
MKSIPSESLKVLITASEAEPFIKVGGLGDVAGSLPGALLDYFRETPNLPALDIRLFIPFHSKIQASRFHLEKVLTFSVPSTHKDIQATVYICNDLKYPVYLIAGESLPADGAVYDPNPVVDGRKFTFFSLAVLEFCRLQNWIPDILHANDWHTAMLPYLIKENKDYWVVFEKTRTILGVHN